MKFNEFHFKSKPRINILLPEFGVLPMGGFKIAYTYANYLAHQGYEVNLIHAYTMDKICDLNKYISYLEAKVMIYFKPPNWFKLSKKINKKYTLLFNNYTVNNADITIATAWNTARDLNKLNTKKGRKLYFIQGYEVCFAPKKDVDETWKYDMKKIVVSRWLKAIGQKMECNDLEYIPNAINYKKFKINKKISERANVISMMYSKSKLKGSKDGIAALKILKNKFPDIEILLFGVDERINEIPKWMKYFQNPSQETLINKVYNESSIFISTSYTEGWGLPPMEAMACGCAVVTTASGGVEDFAIDNETALLCEAGNIDELVDKVGLLIENKEIRFNIAYKGNNYVQRFTWKESFRSFNNVIKSLL